MQGLGRFVAFSPASRPPCSLCRRGLVSFSSKGLPQRHQGHGEDGYFLAVQGSIRLVFLARVDTGILPVHARSIQAANSEVRKADNHAQVFAFDGGCLDWRLGVLGGRSLSEDSSAAAAELKAGVARVDITPPLELNSPLGGYGERMNRRPRASTIASSPRRWCSATASKSSRWSRPTCSAFRRRSSRRCSNGLGAAGPPTR